MNITDPLNKTGKIVMTLGAAFVLSCCAVYAANKEPKEERIVTTENIIIDDKGNKKVVIEFSEGDGVTYIQENDQYYILEGGDKRPMTVAERKEFEQKHEAAQKHLHMTEQELVLVEKELENAHRVLVLHEDELRDVEIEIENAHKALAEAQREIEIDYQKGNISKEEMEQAREAILKAKEEMSNGKMRNRIHVDMERARADMGKARADIEKQRHLREVDIRKIRTGDASGTKSVEATINENGVIYKKVNGAYTIEENGQSRSMTNGEIVEFEKRLKNIPEPPMLSSPRKPIAPGTPESPKNVQNRVYEKSEIRVTDPANVNEKAIPTFTSPPEYPKYAAENGIAGHVMFTFDVDADGKPYNIRATESEPQGVFDEVATKAIEQWKFEKNKQASNIKYKLDFRLE